MPTPPRLTSQPAARAATLAQIGLLGGALLFGLVYAWIVASRISYPFELEWMEGATVDHVRRVLDGRPIYTAPTLEFIPFIYPPLYYYASALLAIPLGLGLFPLRLLSAAAATGSALLVFDLVRRESRQTEAAILAGSLFLATYGASGYWFDLARVDSLFVCLALAGVWALRFGAPGRGAVAAGLLFALATLTKQSALFVAVVLAGAQAAVVVRHRFTFVAAFAIPLAACVLLLDAASDGWFRYYVFSLPAQHPWTPELWLGFWTSDLLDVLPVAAGLSAYALIGSWSDRDRRGVLFAGLACGFIGTAYLGRLHEGGYLNTLMPAHAALAVLFGLGYARARSRLDAAGRPRPLMRLALYAVCMVQFALLVYNPIRQIPRREDEAAGQRFVERVAAIGGEVYVPFHGHLPSLAGKTPLAHEMAIRDIFKGRDEPLARALQAQIDDALRARRFSAIILDSPSVFRTIDESYAVSGPVFEDDRVFWPVTGKRTRPSAVHVPR